MLGRLVFVAVLLGGGIARADTAEQARVIARAKKIYAETNARLAKLKKVKKSLDGFSLEGGDATAWLDGDKVRRVETEEGGESCVTTSRRACSR